MYFCLPDCFISSCYSLPFGLFVNLFLKNRKWVTDFISHLFRWSLFLFCSVYNYPVILYYIIGPTKHYPMYFRWHWQCSYNCYLLWRPTLPRQHFPLYNLSLFKENKCTFLSVKFVCLSHIFVCLLFNMKNTDGK